MAGEMVTDRSRKCCGDHNVLDIDLTGADDGNWPINTCIVEEVKIDFLYKVSKGVSGNDIYISY